MSYEEENWEYQDWVNERAQQDEALRELHEEIDALLEEYDEHLEDEGDL